MDDKQSLTERKKSSKIFQGNISFYSTYNPNPEDLDQALALRYRVYVEEMNYYDKSNLDKKFIEEKQLWDNYDFDSMKTCHVFAKNTLDNQIIGAGRLIDGEIPLSEVPNLEIPERAREYSKVVADPNYRSPLVVSGIFGMMIQASRGSLAHQAIFSSFDRGNKLYRKTGAQEISTFENSEFRETSATVYLLDVDRMEDKGINNPGANKRLIQQLTTWGQQTA